MKKLYFYHITEAQFEKTEYRPLGVGTDWIETEDDWNYGDIIENDAEYAVEKVADCRDLMVWKVTDPYDDNPVPEYVVEIKQD